MVFALLLVMGCWFLWKKRTPGLGRFDLSLAWIIKIGASFFFLWVYTYYYGDGVLTADPETFVKDSAILAAVAEHSVPDYLRFLFGMETPEMIQQYLAAANWTAGDLTLINDSRNVIRVNSLVYFVSGGNIRTHLLVFTFISLLGFRELYLAFADKINHSKRLFWFILITFPSVLFWTGSILKEPMMIVGLCLVLRAVFGSLTFSGRMWRLILGVALMLAFKPYVLICLFPALIFYYVTKYIFSNRIGWSLLSLTGVLVVLLLLFPEKRDDATYYLTRKQYDFINIGRGGLHAYADTCFFYFRPDQFRYLEFPSDTTVYLKKSLLAKLVTTGKAAPFRNVYLLPNTKQWINYYQAKGCKSMVEVTEIRASFKQLLLNIPEAFTNAAFRPFLGDPGGVLKFPAIVETVLLFGFFALQFRFWKQAAVSTKLQVVTLVLFACVLLLLIGWITPVLGAVVRYRIPAYLAFLVAALILHKQKKEKIYE